MSNYYLVKVADVSALSTDDVAEFKGESVLDRGVFDVSVVDQQTLMLSIKPSITRSQYVISRLDVNFGTDMDISLRNLGSDTIIASINTLLPVSDNPYNIIKSINADGDVDLYIKDVTENQNIKFLTIPKPKLTFKTGIDEAIAKTIKIISDSPLALSILEMSETVIK